MLWFVPDRGYSRVAQGHDVTVTRVGRAWAYTGGGWRCPVLCMDTLEEKPSRDGFGYRGQAYRSREAYEARVALAAAWEPFRRWVGATMTPPDGVDLEWIAGAAKHLGMKQ